VRKFLHDHIDPGVFAPDAVRTLTAAFDGAWQSITASGARLSGQQSELTRERRTSLGCAGSSCAPVFATSWN
jgi:hypothetical protein